MEDHFRIDFSSSLSHICTHLNVLSERSSLGSLIARFDRILDPIRSGEEARTIRCHVTGCPFSFSTLWICATSGCGHVGCGRRDGAHALDHRQQRPGHDVVLKLSTNEIWCYSGQAWLGQEEAGRHPIEAAHVEELLRLLHETTSAAIDPVELQQRRRRERWLRLGRVSDHRLAVVPLAWQKAHERFIIGDAAPPGYIDNSSFVNVRGQFRSTLVYGVDYSTVSLVAWEGLSLSYGAGPVITVAPVGEAGEVDPPEFSQWLAEQRARDEIRLNAANAETVRARELFDQVNGALHAIRERLRRGELHDREELPNGGLNQDHEEEDPGDEWGDDWDDEPSSEGEHD